MQADCRTLLLFPILTLVFLRLKVKQFLISTAVGERLFYRQASLLFAYHEYRFEVLPSDIRYVTSHSYRLLNIQGASNETA
jgi:hypothetical protein